MSGSAAAGGCRLARGIALGCCAALLLTGCATTRSGETKKLIASAEDPKYTAAMVEQLEQAGADDAIIRERFAVDQKLREGRIGQREYETEMGKLQVRMDANRIKREKEARDRRTALSVLQTVAGAALSAVL